MPVYLTHSPRTPQNMKALIIILVTLMYQNDCVSGSFIDYLAVQMNQFKDSIADSFTYIKDKIKNFLMEPDSDFELSEESDLMVEHDVKRSFNDFVEKTAAESETEHPESLIFRSEPTALMSTPQLAMLHGKRVESHVVQTEDGYLLTLHRIHSSVTNSRPVIFHHGLLGSSADWILLGPERSLPYLLANAGYDVWMVNARGNYYSRSHITHKVESRRFWNFSWQEMGEFDLPAVIDYIRKNGNKSVPIDYIGHSMGATAFLVLLSMKPIYNEYIKMGILLAPLAFMSKIEGPFKLLSTMSSDPPEHLLKFLGTGEFLPSRKVPKWLMSKYCEGSPLYCSNPVYFFAGGIPKTNAIGNSSFVATILYHVPAGGSTNTILHYAQVVQDGVFHSFGDIYTKFHLNQITAPIVLFSSSDDWLANISDVFKLYFNLGNPVDHYVIRGKNFSHTEFVWGLEAYDLVFLKVMEYLGNGVNRNFITNEIV